ncbi:MAG: polysaccharide deacetylase family protein [Janthinobacterium lividum]
MFKQLAGLAVHHSGAIELVRRLNENQVRILMYHRFPRQHGASFEKQCSFVAANYHVVSLSEAVQRLKRNEPLTNMIVLTMDDGYADVHEVAFPILQKYRLPATLFITTGFIKRTCWMPGDRVRYHFAQTAAETVTVTDEANRVHAFRTKGTHASDEFRALLKRVPERTKRRMLSELDGDLPVLDAASMSTQYRPCTWAQLRELADGGIAMGAHTVTHPILSRVEAATEAEQEIIQSKTEIEQELQRPVESFAYPNGMREDISQISVNCVRAHFKSAVTAVAGLNAPGSDLHGLLRLPCEPDLSVPQMARLLAGPVRRNSAQQPTAYLS